jgi:hypothetical protein
MAMLNPETQRSLTPAGWSNPVEQCFSAPSVFAAFPVAFVFGCVAVSLLSAGQRPIGVIFLVVAVGAAVMGLRVPYVAIAGSDGSLTFKALTRTIRTDLSHVERITHASGARGGSTWVFYFDETRAQLNNRSGRTLAEFVVDHNPDVEYPSYLDRRP